MLSVLCVPPEADVPVLLNNRKFECSDVSFLLNNRKFECSISVCSREVDVSFLLSDRRLECSICVSP